MKKKVAITVFHDDVWKRLHATQRSQRNEGDDNYAIVETFAMQTPTGTILKSVTTEYKGETTSVNTSMTVITGVLLKRIPNSEYYGFTDSRGDLYNPHM